MTRSTSITWMTFNQLKEAIADRRWQVTAREIHASVDSDGYTHRLVRKVIDTGEGVAFVADNSVQSGSETEARDEATVAAFLAVEAARALPQVAAELQKARNLLERVQSQIGGQLGGDVADFLATTSYADSFDGRHRTL